MADTLNQRQGVNSRECSSNLSGDAADITFDPSNCDDITATNVQDAIDELCAAVDVSASPGFTWGRSGNGIAATSYLLNDTVPSNQSGRMVPLTGEIVTVFVANANSNTFDITIQRRTGPGTFTDLATISLTAERVKTETLGVPVAVSLNDEIAVKVSSGTCDYPVVGVVIKGST